MSKIGKYELICEILITFILLWIFQFNTYIRKYLLAFIIFQFLCGRYRDRNLLIWDEITLLMQTHIFYFIFCLLIAPHDMYSVEYVVKLFFMVLISFCLIIIEVRTLHIVLRNICKKRTLIFGVGKTSMEISSIINGNRFSMIEIEKYVNCNELGYRIQTQRVDKNKTIYFHQVDDYLKKHKIDSVIFAIPEMEKEQLNVLRSVVKEKVPNIVMIPRVEGTISFNTSLKNLDGYILIDTSVGLINEFEKILKRCIDILAGLVGTLICIPLTVFVYRFNRKCDDKGPIFFKQKRIGLDGKPFTMYKYRTMVVGADEILKELMENNPEIKEEYETNKKLENDPRVTKAGAFLRKTSLDEFPQFINVLKGDMSLIGPRPYLFREIDDMGDYYSTIIKSKPGVTGMWQTHGRNETDFQERLELDELYYRNWNIELDIQLLIRTFQTVLMHVGAK